jgi:mono/diheme cytochrome c family protein
MRQYARRFLGMAGLLSLGVLTLAGCSDQYSDAVNFRVRTDPVFLDKPSLDDRFEADPPGTLPLMKLDQINDILSPYYGGRDKMKVMDPEQLSEGDRQKFQQGLEKLFGTPQEPHLFKGASEDAIKTVFNVSAKELPETIAHGGRYYRVQCLTCHGLEGDGRGPTAPWVNPHPRDYRPGKFKFTSVNQVTLKYKPLREDLHRTLYNGVEGTSMPAFNLLSEKDLQLLVSYVIYLSIRGQSEYETMKAGADEVTGEFKAKRLEKSIGAALEENAKLILDSWVESQSKKIDAVAYPFDRDNAEKMKTSVLRGYALFTADPAAVERAFPGDSKAMTLAKEYKCATCHIDFGRRAKFAFDEWGTLSRPANLTINVYRGGRRPIDLYWRMHSGINGSGMAAFGSKTGDKSEDERIWDVVNFVEALPYPGMRAKYGIIID